MKRRHLTLLLVAVAGFCLAPLPAHALPRLSATQLNTLDRYWDFFTPNFKAAIHELVATKDGIVLANAEATALNAKLPDLQKRADAEKAIADQLREELAAYDHTDEADFKLLKIIMSNPAATPDDQRIAAQTYVWSYPTSSHLPEARQYLEVAQTKLAAQVQAEKDAEAARAAAQVKFMQRVQSHDLSLSEWRDFLQNMSQEDLMKYMGKPQFGGDGYWIYSGAWTEDPVTHQKVGLRLNFNGTRVLSVSGVTQ